MFFFSHVIRRALPDAYNNSSNPFLTTMVIRLITEDDLWPGRIALPFRVTEGENKISWDEMHFNKCVEFCFLKAS